MSNGARPRVVYPNEATDNDMNRQRYFGLTPTLLNLAFFAIIAALAVGGVFAAGGPNKALDEAKQAAGLDKPQVEVVGGQPWPTAPTPAAAPAVVEATPAPAVYVAPDENQECPAGYTLILLLERDNLVRYSYTTQTCVSSAALCTAVLTTIDFSPKHNPSYNRLTQQPCSILPDCPAGKTCTLDACFGDASIPAYQLRVPAIEFLSCAADCPPSDWIIYDDIDEGGSIRCLPHIRN